MVDLLTAGGGAGFDEGWSEGSIDAEIGIDAGLHASACHGIDLGVDVAAAAEANAHLRLLVLGARANVGVSASAGVRGKLTAKPNIFDEFGVSGRVEAAAQVSARARLELGLEAEYVAELAADQLDGIALELFLAFLREIRVGGGVAGSVAYSAMAAAWLSASGRLGDDEDSGFVIGGGYAVGLEGGYSLDYFMKIGFDNPRRFFTSAVDIIVEAIVEELEEQLPIGSEIAVELFKLLVPVALTTAYDVGQRSITDGISTPEQIVKPFIVAFTEELQRYLIDKVAEFAAEQVSNLISEALVRLTGRTVTAAERQPVEDAAQALIDALADGEFSADDLDEVLALAIAVAELSEPEMVARFREPISLLWTGATLANTLRDAGALVAGADISLLGFGVGARVRVRDMPPVQNMPTTVRQEYLSVVQGFDGTSLTFEHAIDYLITTGVGDLLVDYAPRLSALLEQLQLVTGLTPGVIVGGGIQGAFGGNVSELQLYTQIRDFVRRSVDEVISVQIFDRLDDLAGSNPDANLYMNEVARPSIELMLNFVFGQLDGVVDDPSALSADGFLGNLQSGLSALLYKIVARNLVVMEQILADHVRGHAVDALGELEEVVRDDSTSEIMEATVDHVDEVLASISSYVPAIPGSTGLTDDQLDAIQTFAAEMLNIAQESFSEDVFTDARWTRRREAMLALLLTFDAEIEWSLEDLEATMRDLASCAFVPDEAALFDLLMVHLEILGDQAAILLRRLPQPLAELMLAFSLPGFLSIEQLSRDYEAAKEWALGLAQGALAAIETALGDAAALLAAAIDELSDAIDDAIDELKALQASNLRNGLLVLGRANLRSQAEDRGWLDPAIDLLVDGFEVTLDVAMAVLGGLIDIGLDAITDASDFLEDVVDEVVGALDGAAMVAAGGTAGFQPAAVTAFGEAFGDGVQGLFFPSDGSDPDDGLTVIVPDPFGDFIALAPADIVSVVAEAAIDLLTTAPIIGPVLNQVYAVALQAAASAGITTAEANVRASEIEHEAVRGRHNTRVNIFSPTPLDPRPDHLVMYGPVVPVSVCIDNAGSWWALPGTDSRRVQITINGAEVIFAASEWVYDGARAELVLDSELRLDNDQLRPGLNILEVSVAHDTDRRLRTHVEFLVDPDAPVLGTDLIIDPDASTFDSPGSDHANAIEEFVALRRTGSNSLALDGWRLRDKAGHQYDFGQLSVRPGRLLRVRTGGDPDDDTQSDLHWGRKRAVWNNNGDTVQLIDADGVLRSQYVYEEARS